MSEPQVLTQARRNVHRNGASITRIRGMYMTGSMLKDILIYIHKKDREIADLERAIQRLLTNPVTKCYTGGLL